MYVGLWVDRVIEASNIQKIIFLFLREKINLKNVNLWGYCLGREGVSYPKSLVLKLHITSSQIEVFVVLLWMRMVSVHAMYSKKIKLI